MTTATYPTAPSHYERDEDLAAGLASLAPDAWRQLFDEQYDAVHHYAQLRMASTAAAAEIVSLVFTNVVVIAPKFPASRSGSTALLLDLTDRLIGKGRTSSSKAWRDDVSHDSVRENIGRLNANERNVVLLRLIEGHPAEVTARMLRTTAVRVRWQQMRALRQLSREHGGFAHDGTSGLEETLDGCIDRLTGGESLEEVLSAQHGRTLQLLPVLRVTYGVVRLPRDPPRDDARSTALAAMLRDVEVARFQRAREQRARDERAKAASARGHLPKLRVPSVHAGPPRVQRPGARAWRGVAAIGAIGVAAGIVATLVVNTGGMHGTLGASHLTPEVLTTGIPVAEEPGTIWLAVGSDLERVETTPDTVVLRGDARVTLDGLNSGSKLEVIGTEQIDGTVRAAMVRIRDDRPATNASAP